MKTQIILLKIVVATIRRLDSTNVILLEFFKDCPAGERGRILDLFDHLASAPPNYFATLYKSKNYYHTSFVGGWPIASR